MGVHGMCQERLTSSEAKGGQQPKAWCLSSSRDVVVIQAL